jgi:hypothetical protein
VAAVWKDNHLMTPIGGGVSIAPAAALRPENRSPDEMGAVKRLRGEMKPPRPAEQWWWD